MLQKLKKRIKDQRGMTLIELLAVIVILGIIAAIAVPSVGRIINNSRNKAQVAEGLQIIDAAKLYEANQSSISAGDLTKTQLDSYLDHVKDDGYTVTVTVDSTSGKASYYLKSHPAVNLVDGDIANSTKDQQASEQELTNYNP